jgi:hypothetical protein
MKAFESGCFWHDRHALDERPSILKSNFNTVKLGGHNEPLRNSVALYP